MSDVIYFKAYCDWQIYGEGFDTKEWVNNHFNIWQGAGASNDDNEFLADYQVTFTSDNGAWGLRFAEFWVITPVYIAEIENVKEIIKARLDRMVGDTDVSVRFLEKLEGQKHTPTL